MSIRRDVTDRVHGHCGNVYRPQALHPRSSGALNQRFAHDLVQWLGVLHAAGEVGKPRVLDPFGTPHHFQEIAPVLIGVRQYTKKAVCRLVRAAAWVNHPWTDAGAGGRLKALFEQMLHHDEVRQRFEHGNLDVASLATALPTQQRGEQADSRIHPRNAVCHRHGHIARDAIAAISRHQIANARHPLNQVVICGKSGVRPIAAIACDARVDDRRIHGPQIAVRQAKALHSLGTRVADDCIGILGQVENPLPVLRLLQVQDDAVLAAIGAQVIGADAFVIRH